MRVALPAILSRSDDRLQTLPQLLGDCRPHEVHPVTPGVVIRVTILDTGIDRQHPDFTEERPIVARSFLRTDGVDDPNGHGTHCAGILRGPKDPAERPRYGVASNADLYIAKVLDDQANGSDGDILAGIDWAIRNGCAVVSMSLGTAVLAGTPTPRSTSRLPGARSPPALC